MSSLTVDCCIYSTQNNKNTVGLSAEFYGKRKWCHEIGEFLARGGSRLTIFHAWIVSQVHFIFFGGILDEIIYKLS